MKIHIQREHDNPDPSRLACDHADCRCTFKNEELLERHQRLHHQTAMFPCLCESNMSFGFQKCPRPGGARGRAPCITRRVSSQT
ncbi:hypothetical protein BC940DRAFT_332231 [Gongronella butleri]|nr:hypothetical protein BC940DRAFT_332231 [Gongronella butleri]